MFPDLHILILTAVVAILGATVLLLLSRQKQRRHEEATAHDEELTTLRSSHAAEVQAIEDRHATELTAREHQHREAGRQSVAAQRAQESDLRAAHANREAELKAQAVMLEKERDSAIQLAGYGMRWEMRSREALVTALNDNELDAVIATNVVFMAEEPGSARFCAQIDHLVITDDVIIIVDSKNWQGLIFDGIHPSAHSSVLSGLIDDADLPASFAIHMSKKNASGTVIEVRYDLDSDSPAKQTRAQALRFRALLSQSARSAPIIRTCVFYSHPASQIVSTFEDAHGTVIPTVIADLATLSTALREIHDSHPNEVSAADRSRVIETVRLLGADLIGVGRWAAEYASPVPLDTVIDKRKKTYQRPKPDKAR